ncbi:MAG: hypothetical protein ACHQIG_00160 [Acidimicrobiia bacterium]
MADPVQKQGTGWVAFAGVILILAGLLDVVNGLWALDHKNTPGDALLYENNLERWGWFYVIVGIVVIVAGFAVFQHKSWAVTVGVIVAVIGAVTNMFWIFQFPIASIVLVIIYVMVIYALVVYGGREQYVE